ncbi:hypothetical protein AOL_s00215g197 [Orbilia oligospora ATCC 24927]|uniref:Nucleoporin Nup54 alpha-helical domain-containing protein n=2 Tax=Orbilia oligospora TaxID=2813651 RepID=G1XTR8_ARTOA|nr:hypothetical protein AOL_s00215g197 [Orbilia oligospora ATCC 24927]EGX43461.1 hypothetical protein AOL_s00215g197 [Orbilia oligospora ATCC 24927]KAF3280148.1 hypothetical protein TWF970_002904 [Orbilia oligospora]
MSIFGPSTAGGMQPSQGGNFGGVKGPSPFLPSLGGNTASAGGLFGQTQQPQQPQQQIGNTGGLFGQSTTGTGAMGGGPFGQTATNAGAMGGGLFGQTNNNAGTFGQPAASTLGGGGGGIFGQQQQQQQPQQQASLFGQPQQPQQAQQLPSLGSVFGMQQPQANLFGQSQLPAQQQQLAAGSMFGGGLQSGFGRTVNQPPPPTQTTTAASLVAGQVERIWNLWNVASPDCQFQTYLYNQVDNEALANSYEPGPTEDKVKFDAAMRKRPNPKSVPVIVRGFDDLKIRMQQQENQIAVYRATLHGINNRLTELSRNHDIKTTIKLAEALARHQQLAHRTLSLSAKVQVLKNRGYALQPEEDQLKKKLEVLTKMVSDPSVNGRMNEIWARMQIINQKAKQMEHEISEMSVTVDPEQIQKMATVLQTHEKGIKGLRDELQRLEEAFGQWEKEKQAQKDRQFGR